MLIGKGGDDFERINLRVLCQLARSYLAGNRNRLLVFVHDQRRHRLVFGPAADQEKAD
jgi:hypothetical protein